MISVKFLFNEIDSQSVFFVANKLFALKNINMKNSNSRRLFLKTLAISAATAALAPVLKIQSAFADPVKADDPLVKALGYVENAKTSKDRKDKKAQCDNCQFYLGDAKAKVAKCQLIQPHCAPTVVMQQGHELEHLALVFAQDVSEGGRLGRYVAQQATHGGPFRRASSPTRHAHRQFSPPVRPHGRHSKENRAAIALADAPTAAGSGPHGPLRQPTQP